MTSDVVAAQPLPLRAPSADIGGELRELEEVSRSLVSRTRSTNTQRAYAKAWRSFSAFCADHDLDALPAHPEAVRWYVAWMSLQHDRDGLPRFSVATVRQYLAGVADHHLRAGLVDPTTHRGVSDLVRGLSRLRATRPRRKRPLLLDDVVRVIQTMDHDVYPAGITAARDALALWLGFAGALRRSEAASLRLGDVEIHPVDGVHLRLGSTKADQEAALPDVVVLPFGSRPLTCPVCALHRWVALVTDAQTSDSRIRRRALMRRLYSFDPEVHCCGADGEPGLVSAAELTGSTPLLRATYRNRSGGRIHDAGVGGDALHTMLLRRLSEAGIDPSPYGFHSLRAGHATAARRAGAPTEEIMRAGRWRRAETVDVYDREFSPAARNSVTRLGL